MPTFEELMNDPEVANHPLLDGWRQASNVREFFEKRAQQFTNLDTHGEEKGDKPNNKLDPKSFVDWASGGPGMDDPKADQDARGAVHTASLELHNLLSQFNMPIFPKLSFNKLKDVKYANSNSDRIREGKVVFNVEMIALSGVKKNATIEVNVVGGVVIPPSVMEVDKQIHVISQSTINDILGRVTSYETKQLRSQFEPPFTRQEREMAVQQRNQIGLVPRDNYFDYMNRPKPRSAAEEVAEKPARMIPTAYERVVELMEKAEDEGVDTFPRAFNHLLRNYILNEVSTADKDKWMIHLINDGFCINPYGHGNNRGRTRPRKASDITADFDKEMPMEVTEEPVEMEEVMEDMTRDLPSDMLYYRDTRTPIECSDAVKFSGHDGPSRGNVVDVDIENGYIIVKSKGMEYRVHVDSEDFEPSPKTFQKMYK